MPTKLWVPPQAHARRFLKVVVPGFGERWPRHIEEDPGSYIVSDLLTKYSNIACRTRLLGLAGIRFVPVEDIDWAEEGGVLTPRE